MDSRFLRGALIAAAAVALHLPTQALATSDDFSAGDQYVEQVPTGQGSRDAGRHAKGGKTELSGGALARLNSAGGSDAAALERVATSTGLGAPTAKLRGASSAIATPSIPAAAVDAVGSGGGWLIVVLAIITLLTLGAVGHRHYGNRPGR